MSDEGFHEIQLSGKQLVFLFMSGAVLLVVAFLLGVDVGRGVPVGAGDTTVAVAATPEGTTVPDTMAPEGDPAVMAEPELSYHEMLLGEAAPTESAAGGTAPPPISEPKEAVSPAAVPAPPEGDWILQMGAYSTRAVADDQVKKLTQLKVPAFVLAPTTGSPDKLFRVRVGPYADRAEAEQVKSRLERQGFSSLITR